ncbi:hypothetical protein ACFO26_08075 [Lactococcus nasutitermitis]|uniref:Uncharacterized protein n=1 Tax=Lactococcus nasutitermitis TaxID=1652957 RepID=A0ABV9JET7_9LACT|nr:hypothetical protein [Lactococcus nasutitermitis]
MFSFLFGLVVLAFIVSIFLAVFGVIAWQVFYRIVLPIFVLLLILRIIFAGIMLLFNPHFWIFVAIVALVVWLLGKFKGKR